MIQTAVNGKKNGLLSLAIILLLAIILWVALRGPGTDADGLDYAILLETDNPVQFLISDHLLWHQLVWISWKACLFFDPQVRAILAQQLVNLIIFTLTLLAIWNYFKANRRMFWLVGLGLLASFSTLKALVGEDVDSGPILITMLVLTILPGSKKPKSIFWIVLILSIAPILHRSLFLLSAGWWLAETVAGDDKIIRRIIRSSLILSVSVVIALFYYYTSWLFLISNQQGFFSWFFIHGSGTDSFFSLNPAIVVKGLALAVYRSFFSITPYKAFALGSTWGLIGMILSAIASIIFISLLVRLAWKGKKKEFISDSERKLIKSLFLLSLPGLVFFLFWIPGYYTYWSRFVPVLWILLTILTYRNIRNNWFIGIFISLLLLINLPSQFSAKQGEEAGRLSQWLSSRINRGDLLILPGNGVFYFGVMPKYYYHVETTTLHVMQGMDDPKGYLLAKATPVWQQGHKVWLLLDYAEWTSERLIQGEQARFDKGMVAVEQAFVLGPKAEFIDPAMKEAWIAECLPRQ